MSTAVEIIFVALLGYFLVLNSLYLAIGVVALFQLHRERGREYIDLEQVASSAATLPLSVLIPAYNESLILRNVVLSLLGSAVWRSSRSSSSTTDRRTPRSRPRSASSRSSRTTSFTRRHFRRRPIRGTYRSRCYPNVWMIDKQNGGAADALNAGLNLARYPFVAHIDADCVVEPDALIRLMRPINFAGDEVVVAGATLRVANGLDVTDGRIDRVRLPGRLVERFQLIEYLSAYVLNRLGWGALNSIPVISGGCGVWPKRVMMDLGGFSTTDTHFDIEATIHAHAELQIGRGRLPDPERAGRDRVDAGSDDMERSVDPAQALAARRVRDAVELPTPDTQPPLRLLRDDLHAVPADLRGPGAIHRNVRLRVHRASWRCWACSVSRRCAVPVLLLRPDGDRPDPQPPRRCPLLQAIFVT